MLAALLSACGAGPGNSNSNGSATNTNTNKTTTAAPTIEALLDLDKKATEAYMKGDSKYFEGMLSDKFSMVSGGMRLGKPDMVKMIGGVKCDVKDGWTLDDPKMTMIDADTYAVSYKGTFDGSCTFEGKTEKLPNPVRAVSVYLRNGDKWQGVFHGENPIIDMKNPPAAPLQTPPQVKVDDPKEAPKPGDKQAANSNSAPAAATGLVKSPNTDALVALEKSGWVAWKMKDAKRLEDITGKNMAILTGDGTWMTRSEAIKYWTEMPCENVKTVDVKDGYAIALSPNVEMMTFKGSADGTCYGQKNGTQDSMSIYVKEDGVWKLAFNFSAAMM